LNHLEQKANIAALIDHTLLKPEATQADIVRLCAEARQWSFASVCINPCWVRLAGQELSGTPVRVCTVIGFPLGANETRTKIAEADIALAQGARELDMVQNIGALRSRDYHRVYKDMADLADIAHSSGAILKVILETCLLSNEEKEKACRLAMDAKADFVKTSTGFSTAGATVEDVALMRRIVGDQLGVKASGGVRTLAALQSMVHAGANRMGTSSGVSIMEELEHPAAQNKNAPEQSATAQKSTGIY
jgi:deoxyribose-phosphate aldolase